MAAATPPAKKRSLSQRYTEKVGPLPVWAWALLILIVGYLIYRHSKGSSSSSDTSSTSPDTSTSTEPDTSGTPGPDRTGGGTSTGGPDAASLNDELLSQLAGYGNSIDALTAAILSSEAFVPGAGDSGSGSVVPNGTPAPNTATSTPEKPATQTTSPHGATTKTKPAAAKLKPAPTLVSEHGRGGGYTPTKPKPRTTKKKGKK